MKKTVAVGISGGVDSSVAAYLLKQQGYNVIGLFMVNWEEKDGTCTQEEDYEDVKRVCSKIGIPYYSLNFTKEYYDRVFSYFLSEYEKGRTPNPDVLCNREIKFGPFLEFAEKVGADFIATGHYAKTVKDESGVHLFKSFDKNKDQTYFLNQLKPNQLEKVIFPLADIDKPTVRKIAADLDLSTAQKKDSTGICFIGERNFRKFLSEYLPAKPGLIKTLSGEVIGNHDGLMYYTLGQRRGLGIGGKSGYDNNRWFVVKKDLKENVLYVSFGECDELFSGGLISNEINWISRIPEDGEHLQAKFRYRQPDQNVTVFNQGKGVKVLFEERQRAVTPGQYVVFYDKDECLGGGVIDETFD